MRRVLLFIVNNPDFFLSHRLNIAQAAQAEGWDVHVATPAAASVTTILGHGFRHHEIGFSRSAFNPLQELRVLVALFVLLRRLRPALVHAVTIKPVLYGGLVAPLAGVPALVLAVSGLGHVFIAKGIKAALRRSAVRLAYRLAFRHRNSRVILQNRDDRAVLSSALRPGQAVIVPGAGVDPDAFAPTAEPAGKPVVLLASRMLWSKGVGEFVEAVRILKGQGVDAVFRLVGASDPGNPAAVPLAELDAWVGQGLVEWAGHVEDVAAEFQRASIVCLPSYREGLPKVLIEAAAAGRALVATDVPGCREIVVQGENGLLVPALDATALAEALSTLIAAPQLRAAMAKRGRERFLAGFTSERVVQHTLAVYRELLAEQVAGQAREPH